MRKINANELLDPKFDRELLSVLPTDMTEPANLTVEDVKELLLTVVMVADRDRGLRRDLECVEQSLAVVEQQLAVAEHRISILSKIVAAGAEVSDEE